MTTPLTIAVVGAKSFVGQALCKQLEGSDHDTMPLTRSDFDVADHSAEFSRPIDVAVFLAQDRNYTALDSKSLSVFAVNTVGVLNTAIKARDAGARSFLFASTGNVYQPSFEPHHEDEPLARSDIYSTSKVFAEQILDLASADLTICRARLFGAYGPDQTIGLMAGLANRIRSGQPVTLQPQRAGEPDAGFTASLSHVDDIASALIELSELSMETPLPSALNVAAPEPTSVEQLAKLIATSLDTTPQLEASNGTRAFDLIADTERCSALLNTSFRDTASGIPEALVG